MLIPLMALLLLGSGNDVQAMSWLTTQNKNDLLPLATIVLPVVILMQAGELLAESSGTRIVYSGLFAGLGSIIGLSAAYLSKNGTTTVKWFVLSMVVVLSGLAVSLISTKRAKSTVLGQDWTTQRIGMIEFDAPATLRLRSSKVPSSVNDFYSKLNLYTADGADRSIIFIESETLVDTLQIEDAYLNALDGIIGKMAGDLNDVDVEVYYADRLELSAKFTAELAGERVSGYGFMLLVGSKLESLWLIPVKQGFTREYIEEFEAGIYTYYD